MIPVSPLRTPLLFGLLAGALVLAACGGSDDGNQGLGTPDSGTPPDTGGGDTTPVPDTTPDAGTDTPIDEDAEVGEDVGTDAEPDTGEPTFEEENFFSCASDSECGGGNICVGRVCVIPPRTAATLAEESETIVDPDSNNNTTETIVTPRPDVAIELGCYSDGGLFEPTEGPESVTLTGVIDRFGSGPATTGLCVSAFDENVLLPMMVGSSCIEIDSDNEPEQYIGCFQLDACRCDAYFGGGDADPAIEQMIAGAEAALEIEGATNTSVDSLETCYSFIGYCAGIEDATIRQTCVDRIRTRSGVEDAETLVLGYATSQENPDNEQAGLFSIENFPTNRAFAYKASGRENRWRDTWEYGLFSRADLARDGSMVIDSNIVGAGAWQTIPPAVGFPGGIDDRNGAVAGSIRDCGVAGEREPFNVVHSTVGIAFQTTDTRLSYFNGNLNNRLPLPGRTDTNFDGLFAAINLPAGPNRVSPVICTANCDSAEAEFTFAGSRNVFQTPKSVVIATFEGIRFPAE